VKKYLFLLAAAAAFATHLRAQSVLSQVTCAGGVTGNAAAGTVSLYEGSSGPTSVPVVNGSFSWPIPPSLQDGKYHIISVGQNNADLIGSPQSFTCSQSAPPTYTYVTGANYFPQAPTTPWTTNGTFASNNGLLGTNSYISVIYGTTITPESISNDSNSTEYEVNATLNITQSGGSYIQYVRASSNAALTNDSTGAGVGTFHAMEIQNPQIDQHGNCSATLVAWEKNNASNPATVQSSWAVPCQTTNQMRTVVFSLPASGVTKVWTILNGNLLSSTTALTTGQPGLGQIQTISANGGNGFANALFGPRSVVSPAPISGSSGYDGAPPSLATSVTPNDVKVHWAQPADPSGVGVMQHGFYRAQWGQGFSYFASDLETTDFDDPTVSPNTTYDYSEQDRGFHGLYSSPTYFATTTPPMGSVDPRQVGIRSTGTYWGGAGEQINTLTGNLNYSVPLLTPQGRGGWTVPLNLTYNSQNWRMEGQASPAQTWGFNLGEDIGYGYGWKLQFGSLTPYWEGGYYGDIDQYLFVDSTGAEYHLNQNFNSIWYSSESIYVWYDAYNNILHFRDGTQWAMGCASAADEPDYGTMYPTEIKDRNGNQILVTYNQGKGASWPNSSARIASIEDVRAAWEGSGTTRVTYVFSYAAADASGIQHLSNIWNYINTGETYTFSYANVTLTDPFSLHETFQNVDTLTSVANAIPLTTGFAYDASGDMTVAELPYGGLMEWAYQAQQYPGGSGQPREQMEVTTRYLETQPTAASTYESGGSPTPLHKYQIAYAAAAPSSPVHPSSCLTDVDASAERCWTFNTAAPNVGLLASLQRGSSSGGFNETDTYTWAQDANGNSSISQTQRTLDPGQAYSVTSYVKQTVDVYGNVTAIDYFDWGAGNTGTPTRAYAGVYRTNCTAGGSALVPWGWVGGTGDCAYTNRYTTNLLTSATMTPAGGSALTLVTNTYDSGSVAALTPNCIIADQPMFVCEHDDTNYPASFTTRGNVTTAVYPDHTLITTYDMTGMATQQTDGQGHATTFTTVSTSNFALPTQITPNSSGMSNPTPTTDSELAHSYAYSSFFGIAQATAQTASGTQTQVSYTYDSNGRPATSTSANGAVTTYAYSFVNSAYTATATTAAPNGNHWASSQLDGFGRPALKQAGYTSGSTQTTLSNVTINYAPCGCSPTGKENEESLPYTGTAGPFTVYTFDAIGRTLSVTLPDGASKTSYTYQGNWTTVVDPAGNWKQYEKDSFGNLIAVVEPDPSAGSPLKTPPATPSTTAAGTLLTSYTYDMLNHLTQVAMTRAGTTQTRTFAYNAAMQLQSVSTPETGTTAANGTVSYTYNADGTTATQTDAKSVVKTYTYDTYQRVTGVTYSVGAGSNYTMTYDSDPLDPNGTFATNAWGRLAEVSWGSCTSAATSRAYTEEYSYDVAGDVIGKRLSILKGGNCSTAPTQITAKFVYDTEGKLTTTTYPSINGGSANTTALDTYDSMSRLQGVSTTETLPAYSNCASAWNGSVAWASSAAYTTANQLSSLTRFIGVVQSCPSGDVFNTTSEIFKYNVNNQLTDIETGTPVVGSYGNWLKDGANYILAGYHYSATQNNGQITSMDDGRQEYSVTYQYDLLKRLVSATAGSNWTQTFGYDGFGNLTSKSTPSGSSELPLPGVNPAKNWLTGYTYDANGNVGSYNNYSLGYDPVNRLSYATTGSFIETYAYDASNHRIERINASLDTVYFFSPSGALLSEFNCLSTCTLIYNRIYFGGMVLGTDGSGVSGNPPSALGDVSTWTDRLGSAQSTYPYGADIGSYPAGADAVDFATYAKEGSTGLEYAMNRYYSGGLGRFMTVDPSFLSAKAGDPQSWNRYSYAGRDPVNFNDASGNDEQWVGSGPCVVGLGEYAEWTDCDYYTESYAMAEPPPGPGGGGGSAFPKCNPNGSPSRDTDIDFILQNYKAAANVAAEADQDFRGLSAQNFSAADVLGWAAAESGYAPPTESTDSALKSGNLDYFNLTAGNNWLNQVSCPGGANSYWACFGNFQGAAEAALFSPTRFSYQGLPNVSAGYVLGQQLGSGASLVQAFQAVKTNLHYAINPTYGSHVQSVINSLSSILDCLQKNYASYF
jgi:RHS repeat-associated protein